MFTILVVDDSATQRARWLYALSGPDTTVISETQPVPPQAGNRVIKVVTAKSGEHALARLRTMKVDLLITDVEMPGMSGWQLALAAQGLSADVRVIVFSANVSTGHNQVPELDPLRTQVISKDDREQAIDMAKRILAGAV